MDLKPFQVIEKSIKGWNKAISMMKHPYRVYFLMRFIAHYKLFNETEENKDKRYAFMQSGGGLFTPKEIKALKYSVLAFLESIGKPYEASKNNKPVVWFDWPVPVGIIKAFDVDFFCPSVFFFLSQPKSAAAAVEHIEACEEEGITDDLCTLGRLSIGAFFDRQAPAPIAIISATQPCDSTRSLNKLYKYYADVPTFTMDAIYDRGEDSIKHFSENAFGMIEFLENVLGKKIDWDKLKQTAEEMNRFNWYCRETTFLNRAIPSPGIALHQISSWLTNIISPGFPALTKMAKIVYEIAKFRVAKPKFLRLKKEKIRIIAGDMSIVYSEIYSWMWKEFGAVIVSDFLGDNCTPVIDTSTKETLVSGIVMEKVYMGMTRQTHGSIQFAMENLQQTIDQCSADCIIFNSHVGCKHNNAARKIIQDTAKRAGLPALFLDVDIFDQRVIPEAEVKRKIKIFFISNGLA